MNLYLYKFPPHNMEWLTNNGRVVIYYFSHLNMLCPFSDNIWNTDLDFLVLGGHQSISPNITLKNMHIEPRTQSILVPQSSSPSTNRSCKYYCNHSIIIMILIHLSSIILKNYHPPFFYFKNSPDIRNAKVKYRSWYLIWKYRIIITLGVGSIYVYSEVNNLTNLFISLKH